MSVQAQICPAVRSTPTGPWNGRFVRHPRPGRRRHRSPTARGALRRMICELGTTEDVLSHPRPPVRCGVGSRPAASCAAMDGQRRCPIKPLDPIALPPGCASRPAAARRTAECEIEPPPGLLPLWVRSQDHVAACPASSADSRDFARPYDRDPSDGEQTQDSKSLMGRLRLAS